MKDSFPGIYKNKINKLKTGIQNEYYFRNFKDNETRNEEIINNNKGIKIDKMSLLRKIDNIFKRPDYVYQADVIIVHKNGENIRKKIIGKKDNYLITFEGEKIYFDEILDIK